MYIIKTFKDLRDLAKEDKLTSAMTKYLENEIRLLHQSYEPETSADQFSLDIHGPIAILDSGDEDLSRLGLLKSLRDLMPEWVSRKTIGKLQFYAVFVLADNDYMNQIYVPCQDLLPLLEEWLAEQAETEEQEEARLPDTSPF